LTVIKSTSNAKNTADIDRGARRNGLLVPLNHQDVPYQAGPDKSFMFHCSCDSCRMLRTAILL